VSFESSLNAVWLLLGVCALTGTIRFSYSKRAFQARDQSWLRVVCASLIVAALFPYISATDDVLGIEHLNEQQKQGGTTSTNQTNELMRLYQAIDTAVVTSSRQATLTLFFVMLVGTLLIQVVERSAPIQSGRSPPRFVPA